MNWNNAPVISGTPLSAAGAVAIGQTVEFNVTAAISGNGIVSFGLSNNASDDVHYSSQEGGAKPELLVEYSTGAPSTPAISSFAPSTGPVGSPVTITGANFTGATSVAFNGTNASLFTVNSSTQIQATVPSSATTGKISVTTGGGTAVSAADFTIGTPPPSTPTITSFTPASGVVGTQVTITGTNFTGATGVAFNGTNASAFTVNSATQIQATVPTGATTGKASVTTAAGTVLSAADFTVTTGGTTTVTIDPFQDSYVKLSTPTTNYGTSTSLRAQKTSSDDLRSYLKFGVSGLTGTVVSAKLRLKVTNASNDGGSVYKVSNFFLSTTTEWDEDGLHWNNAPTISGSPLSSVGAVTIGTFVEWDVKAAVTGNGTYSFAIKNNSSDDAQYMSDEAASKPELVIQISTASLALSNGITDEEALLPEKFGLSPNYPNPFNAQTTIEYALPEAGPVRLVIYNALGQLVRRLVDQTESAGYKRVVWDGHDDRGLNVGSGVYFSKLEAGHQRFSRKMSLQQ